MQKLIKDYIAENTELLYSTLKDLCLIPAPSHFEHERAKYCKAWLEKYGAKGVYIDEAQNTIFPLNCDGSNEITVFAAHLDTVFPDKEPLPYSDDGVNVYCPGCSDDTSSVVVLLLMAKFFIENNIIPEKGFMFVCNSCEEGLGNLKGTRQLFKDFDGRIARFTTFEPNFPAVTVGGVGSHRYNVTVTTEGGHSFSKFGNDNAIAKLAEIINKIFSIEVPKIGDSKTTYNVGTISGGTSVNTIAQKASMLCEYRSDDKDCLDIMEAKFKEIFENARSEKISVEVEKVGDRPCSMKGTINNMPLARFAASIIEELVDVKVVYGTGSTDANIPLSLGIPAIRIGVATSGNIHKREEWVEKAYIPIGLEYALRYGIGLKEGKV